MKLFSYQTQGTCARQIKFGLEDGIVREVEFVGGCPGNLIGLSQLVKDQKVDDLIDRLTGIECRNGTSCPDQLAKALKAFQENNTK